MVFYLKNKLIIDAAHATAGDDIPWVEYEHAIKMAKEQYEISFLCTLQHYKEKIKCLFYV